MKKMASVPTREYATLTPGDRVRIACELLEISQAEVARRAGLNASHLSDIIHGRRAVGLDVAQRLSRVLGLPAARLLGIDADADERRKSIERALVRLKRHIRSSQSIGEATERMLLKDIEDAIEANRATA